jgi:death-on-curing protein
MIYLHRGIGSAGKITGRRPLNYLTPEQVLFIHARMIAETGGSHGVRDLGLLLSAIARPQAAFKGHAHFQKTAALFESLINNHSFIDGNKQTAVAAAGLFLLRNGFRLTASYTEVETFTLSCAQGETQFEQMLQWFGTHSEPVSQV